MPLYDFTCLNCGKVFELSLSLEEREQQSSKKLCPSCSSKNVEQKLSFSGGIIAGGTTSIPNEPPCMSGACCPNGSCPWEKD
ncbi:MAG: hypothetical protein GYA55_01520 [SAR324 cluster bacterium]|uniref:Putative regulatory protein FmdB zinc ribbon domain-containing protein n=1 Tax=SAR324 cluster bacterium TaxID=2024889 RepID=A0A7X9FQ40_9DELT|nr:hypothetical protein [SAR324 cluster bacterium]